MPFRPAKRANRHRADLFHLASVLQPRDRQICLDLYEHKVLTTHQICDLHFDSSRSARRRLLALHRYGVLDRFAPARQVGSAAEHYVLGASGAEIVAAYLGVETKGIYRKDRLARLVHSPFLEHLVAVNTFFSRLVWACRQTTDHRLTEWWGEDRTRRHWASIVAPDGFGRLSGPGRSRSFLLELDLGTESPSRLTHKLPAYDLAAQAENPPDLLLFCFPTPIREALGRKALRPVVGIPLATTHVELHASDPLSGVWLPLGSEKRWRLLEIPAARG